MSDHIKISKIEIEIDKKKITLTTDQAKSLYDKLHDLFASRGANYVPYFPIYIEKDKWDYYPTWTGTDNTSCLVEEYEGAYKASVIIDQ